MQIGLNTWALDVPVGEENIGAVLDQIQSLNIPGKPVVQFFASPDKKDLAYASTIKKEADSRGFSVTTCGFNPNELAPGKPSPHLVSDNAVERKAALERVYGFIDFTAEAATDGLRVLGGPWHTRHKYFDNPLSPAEERGYFLEALGKIAKRAENQGILAGFEVLNRFECKGWNTVKEALRDVSTIGSNYLGIEWDSSHNYVDGGPDFMQTLRDAVDSGYLFDVHLCEHDRMEMGKGQIGPKTEEIIQTLKQGEYKGGVVLELFCEALYPVVGIWRPPKETPYEVAQNSVRFVSQYI